MGSINKNAASRTSADGGKFCFGPPRDPERLARLFSVLLQIADEQSRSGKRFEVPFAFLLRFANLYHPTLDELRQYHERRLPQSNWPELPHGLDSASSNGRPPGMFFDLLAAGLGAAPRFDANGYQLCRVLAAVGQTLGARSRSYQNANRMLAKKYEEPTAPPAAAPADCAKPPLNHSASDLEIPVEYEFRGASEQGGSVVLNTLGLWHASHIGPAAAHKLENQDATYAVPVPGDDGLDRIVFALADGVTTSMGSRIAANSIVRHFCECLMRRIRPHEPISQGDLLEAARETQQSLEGFAEALLHRTNSYVFDMVRGDSIPGKTAERILENTVKPRKSTIPAALSATLIGGATQSVDCGEYRAEILRIGDGVVEQISSSGQVTSIASTDAAVTMISAAVSPGPSAREVLDQPEERIGRYSIALGCGESLIVSSDGLARGHSEPVSTKVSALLGRPFWSDSAKQPDAALKILRTVCERADDAAQNNPGEVLFADNLSLIMIRCGGEP